MQLEVVHTTEYHYPEEAWDSFNELWAYPVDDYRQHLLDFQLSINPSTPVRSRTDYFGNRVYDFHIADGHGVLVVEVKARVLTFSTPNPRTVAIEALQPLQTRFFEYLAPTRRIPLDRNWPQVFGVRPPEHGEDLMGYLEEVSRVLHVSFTYSTAATTVETSLEEFASLRAGVCQDYAQAMLAVLRTVGVPCRYASGYLATGVGSEGSHAWVEVYHPGTGWVGFDPTNHTQLTEQYVKVAHGRDYDDCPPTRGLRRGGGTETLKVLVHVNAHEV